MRWKRIFLMTTGSGVLGLTLILSHPDSDLNYTGFLRLGRAVATLFRIGSHYRRNLISSKLDTSSEQYEELKSQVHTEAANMLLDLCSSNGGVYIKIGQHVGTLNYLVPDEYVKVMKKLHSDAPTTSISDIFKILEEDLQQDPMEIFSCFEEKPLGAASLAQVHKATLKDGRVVAVKIQHPSVSRNSKVDLKTMEVLVNIASKIFKDFDYDWLIEEQKKNLSKELNFKLEGENAEKTQKLLKNFKWLKIPKIYWDLTTERVLTMEYVEGAPVTDLDYLNKTNINRFDLISKIGAIFAHMIYKHGFVHSDPHPGNLLIHKNEDAGMDIVLLDHGQYATFTQDFRDNYSKLWLSILNKDIEGMKFYSGKLGVTDLYIYLVCMVTGRTWDSVKEGIDRKKYSAEENKKIMKGASEVSDNIGKVLATVDRQMLWILKTNDVLRGIEHALKVEQRQPSFLVMTKCCIDNLYEEKLQSCKSSWDRFRARVWRNWRIFKLNIYYMYLNLRSIIPM